MKDSQDLNISYSNETQKLSTYISDHRISIDQVRSISTTSTLKGNYKPDNLLDSDQQTAWVEGKEGNGIGEQIVIELNDYPLAAICMINGYPKDQLTYSTNGKIKKVKLELEVVDHRDTSKTILETSDVILDDLSFKEISENNLSEMISVIADYGDGFMKVRKITITILEVYEGTKYSDICVSEILMLGFQ